MNRPVIQAVGHLAIQTPEIEACIETATQIMGLTESERTGDSVFFSCGQTHHQLQYIEGPAGAVDHVGLEAADQDALNELRDRLAKGGIAMWDPPSDSHFADGVRFTAPGGYVFEAYVGIEPDPNPRKRPAWYTEQGFVGVRPNRFGHVTFRVPDAEPMVRLLMDYMDFRISDRIGVGAFLRCNVDHHGIGAMGPGPGTMHHYAWEISSIADLARLGDRLHETGQHILWGPVRHGSGNNLAAYFADPAGIVVEYYCDMQKIYNDADYVQAEWEDDWYSMWQLGRPEGFGEYGLPAAAPVGQPAGS
jgi:catechol 2,3-dioxygenase